MITSEMGIKWDWGICASERISNSLIWMWRGYSLFSSLVIMFTPVLVSFPLYSPRHTRPNHTGEDTLLSGTKQNCSPYILQFHETGKCCPPLQFAIEATHLQAKAQPWKMATAWLISTYTHLNLPQNLWWVNRQTLSGFLQFSLAEFVPRFPRLSSKTRGNSHCYNNTPYSI